MTPEEYIIYVKKKCQETDELLKQVRTFTRALFNEKTYTEYLILLSRFHRYSFINVLLIQFQFPSATYLSGFETWKNIADEIFAGSSHQVLRYQYVNNGIKILIPFTVTLTPEGQKDRRLIFVPVPVYDINQTNNLPLPENDPLTLEAVDKYLMAAIRSNAPYRFILTDKTDKFIQSGIHSYFDNVNQFIRIDNSLSETAQSMEYIRTWAKKAAFDFIKQKNIKERYAGFITASVEFAVRTALGLNTLDIAFNYVPQYATEDQDELWLVLHGIQTVSHLIIERLTEDILTIQEISTDDWLNEDSIFDYSFVGVDPYEV